VKTWHPDRFASDPAGQAVASERMAHVNWAYRLLAEVTVPHSGGAGSTVAASQAGTRSSPGARLSRAEIDAIAHSIGTESPIDWLLGRVEWALWPMDSTQQRIPSPLSLALGLLILLIVIVIESNRGKSSAYPLVLALATAAVLLSRWKADR